MRKEYGKSMIWRELVLFFVIVICQPLVRAQAPVLPIQVISCDEKDFDVLASAFKSANAIVTHKKSECFENFKGHNECSEGVVVSPNEYIYRGPIVKGENSLLIGLYLKKDTADGVIIWEDGSFFAGEFVNRKPNNGLLVIDEYRYYVGEVYCEDNKLDCWPHGEGKMHYCGEAIDTAEDGRWNKGQPTNTIRSEVPYRKIINSQQHARAVAELESLGIQIESLKYQKHRIQSEINNERAKLEQGRDQWRRELESLQREIVENRQELSNIKNELRVKDVENVKKIINHKSSLKELLSSRSLRPDLYQFKALFYNTQDQMQMSYLDDLKDHLSSFNFDSYEVSNYIIRSISIKALNASWNGKKKPRFKDDITKVDNFFIVASFINSTTNDAYDVYFYKVAEDDYKIIQIYLF